jgi:hypothetical protein
MGVVWLCGGGLEEDLEDFYNIRYACNWLLEQRTHLEKCMVYIKEERIVGNVFILLCDSNEKWPLCVL